jgi:predicted DNA-binding transcriptional regulator AlpA
MRNTTSHPGAVLDQAPDQLVPDPIVAEEFGGITLMTLYRWTNDPNLGFPPPVKIRTKNFRSRRALEDFKARIMRWAVSQRERAK